MTRPVPAPRRCALLASAAALALAAQAPAAQAGVFAPDVIDGPSTEIVSAGDVDVARDGTGAVAYVKREAGAAHAPTSASSVRAHACEKSRLRRVRTFMEVYSAGRCGFAAVRTWS